MEGRIEKLISEMTLKEKLGQLTQELTSLERLDELEELARKGELGFDGFVISDWDAIKRLQCQGVSDSDEMSATLAINAGVDMDMVDGLYKNNLESAVEKGLVSMSVIDEAVRRVLRIKFRLGLFDNPYADENINSDEYLLPKEYRRLTVRKTLLCRKIRRKKFSLQIPL